MSPSQVARLQACATALEGYDLVEYTGVDLATGRRPAVAAAAPSSCAALTRRAAQPPSDAVVQAQLGLQPAALAAFLVAALGVMLAATGLARVPVGRTRALVAGGLGLLGLMLVLVEQLVLLRRAFDDRIESVLGAPLSSLPLRFPLSDYFRVTPGAGFYVIALAFGVAAVWNLGGALTLREREPPTGPGVTPEERPDVHPPPQPGSEPPQRIPAQPPPWPGSPGEREGPPGTPKPPPPHAPG